MKLKDKVALVTGSSSGIGKAIAIGLAEEGADAIINYHTRQTAAAEVVNKIRAMGRRSTKIQADVAKKKEVNKLIEQGWSYFGKIDILVNNAGITLGKTFLEITEESWDKVLNTNLKGSFFCSQIISKKMIENKIQGKIINVSSVNALQVEPNCIHYNVSKGGMHSLTRSLALELAPYNINVNEIAPGFISGTNIQSIEPLDDPHFIRECIRNIPLGRFGTPEDCVGAVVLLASDEGRYIQGQTVIIDGGLTIKQYGKIEPEPRISGR